MTSPEIHHYMLSKLIRAEAQNRCLVNAVDYLAGVCIDEQSMSRPALGRRAARKRTRLKPDQASLLKQLLGSSAIAHYTESEMAHFEEMFPEHAVFVREHLELSDTVSSGVLKKIVHEALNLSR